MVLQINPAKVLLWRSANELQIGPGRQALRLSNLSSGQQRLLNLLYRGIADDFFNEVAEAVGAEDSQSLLEQVKPNLLSQAGFQTNLSPEFIERSFAEICRAQASFAVDGKAVLQMRQLGCIYVQGNSQTADLICQALTEAGVGRLISDSSFESYKDQIDFGILIGQNAVSPADYSPLLRRNINHVSIVFDNDGVQVSPVISNSKSPCLSCFHENLSEQDSTWPAMASQLLFSKQSFDDATARLFAASIACQRALQQLDQSWAQNEVSQMGYRLNVGSGQISEFNWQFNRSCLCRIN